MVRPTHSLRSDEIKTIVAALGSGGPKDFVPENVRSHRNNIMTNADRLCNRILRPRFERAPSLPAVHPPNRRYDRGVLPVRKGFHYASRPALFGSTCRDAHVASSAHHRSGLVATLGGSAGPPAARRLERVRRVLAANALEQPGVARIDLFCIGRARAGPQPRSACRAGHPVQRNGNVLAKQVWIPRASRLFTVLFEDRRR